MAIKNKRVRNQQNVNEANLVLPLKVQPLVQEKFNWVKFQYIVKTFQSSFFLLQ